MCIYTYYILYTISIFYLYYIIYIYYILYIYYIIYILYYIYYILFILYILYYTYYIIYIILYTIYINIYYIYYLYVYNYILCLYIISPIWKSTKGLVHPGTSAPDLFEVPQEGDEAGFSGWWLRGFLPNQKWSLLPSIMAIRWNIYIYSYANK